MGEARGEAAERRKVGLDWPDVNWLIVGGESHDGKSELRNGTSAEACCIFAEWLCRWSIVLVGGVLVGGLRLSPEPDPRNRT